MFTEVSNSCSATQGADGLSDAAPSSAADVATPNLEAAAAAAAESNQPAGGGVSSQPSPASESTPRRDPLLNGAPEKGFPFIRQLLQACTIFPVPSRWKFLLANSDRLRVDMDPLDFAEAIGLDCDHESLVATGIYEFVDGHAQPGPWARSEGPLYVDVDTENLKFHFHNRSDFLFPMSVTAVDLALQQRPGDVNEVPEPLFIVDSEESAEIINAVGFRAATDEGLTSIGREVVRKLFPSDERGDRLWRFHLVLLDFDVAGLDQEPLASVARLIDWLADISEAYEIDPGRRFAFCRPSEAEFRKLLQAVKFEDRKLVGDVFKDLALKARRTQIHDWRRCIRPRTVHLSTARAALKHALSQPDVRANTSEIKNLLADYREATTATVVAKFYAAADAASDPFVQIDYAAAATCAENYFNSDALVKLAEAILEDRSPPPLHDLEMAAFAEGQGYLAAIQRLRSGLKKKR